MKIHLAWILLRFNKFPRFSWFGSFFGTFFYISHAFGAFRGISVYFMHFAVISTVIALRYILAWFGIFWCVLQLFDAFWYTWHSFVFFCFFCNMSHKVGTDRNILIHFTNTDTFLKRFTSFLHFYRFRHFCYIRNILEYFELFGFSLLISVQFAYFLSFWGRTIISTFFICYLFIFF